MTSSRARHLGLALPGILLLVLLPTGCTTAGTPGVPGLGKVSPEPAPIPANLVLLALKAQVADAIAQIDTLKNRDGAADKFKGVFDLKTGTGVFSGEMQTVKTGGLSLTAIIPFTGYADSKLQPKVGIAGTATNQQATSLTFEIDPTIENPITRDNPDLAHVQVGTFITDALVGYFNDAAYFVKSGKYDPAIKFNEIAITATFTVVRTYEAGLGDTIIMVPAPDLDSLGPTASGSRERTGIYKIELKFPLNVDAPPDPRRLAVLQPLADGRSIYVEEPYTEKRYLALTAGRNLAGLDWTTDLIHRPGAPVLNRESQPTESPRPEAQALKPEDIQPGTPLGPVKVPKGL